MLLKLHWKCKHCSGWGYTQSGNRGDDEDYCSDCQGKGRGTVIVSQGILKRTGKLTDEHVSIIIANRDIYGDH